MSRARYLRNHPTKWERVLWRNLRNRNFAGYKFRRQHALDPYILDFYCPGPKLAIELGGGGHNYRSGRRRDQIRGEFFARHGIEVLRFWDHQVREELDSVLQAIWLALEKRRSNNPSPPSSPFAKGRGDAGNAQEEKSRGADAHPMLRGPQACQREARNGAASIARNGRLDRAHVHSASPGLRVPG
ncbi:MAG: hypothetical protein DME64_14015 [Verrucomicrobia bacterium]|nr:MAG: hypothetical protein DME64_14015 [Verrucomicrobiota bacterium]